MTMDRNFTAHFTVTQGLKPKVKPTKTFIQQIIERAKETKMKVSDREQQRLLWRI